MFKKLTAPYRFAPAIVSMDRIDAALAQYAQAEIQSPGRGSIGSTSLVTLRRPSDNVVVDSWTVQGNIRSAHKFVAAYNRRLAATHPSPPPGYQPQQRRLQKRRSAAAAPVAAPDFHLSLPDRVCDRIRRE